MHVKYVNANKNTMKINSDVNKKVSKKESLKPTLYETLRVCIYFLNFVRVPAFSRVLPDLNLLH